MVIICSCVVVPASGDRVVTGPAALVDDPVDAKGDTKEYRVAVVGAVSAGVFEVVP